MVSNNNNKHSCTTIMVFKRRSALAKLRNFQANYSISTVHHRDKEKETVRSSVVSASVAREVLGLKSQ